MTTRIEELTAALDDGAAADIWYDAPSFVADPDDPEDPDAVKARQIDKAQLAMTGASMAISKMHGLLTRLDAAARAAGLERGHGPLLNDVRDMLDMLDEVVADEPEPCPPPPGP